MKKRGKLNIVRPVGRARLRGGAKLTIRVTSRNGVAKQFAFTFRRGAAPIFLIRCAAPGAVRVAVPRTGGRLVIASAG